MSNVWNDSIRPKMSHYHFDEQNNDISVQVDDDQYPEIPDYDDIYSNTIISHTEDFSQVYDIILDRYQYGKTEYKQLHNIFYTKPLPTLSLSNNNHVLPKFQTGVNRSHHELKLDQSLVYRHRLQHEIAKMIRGKISHFLCHGQWFLRVHHHQPTHEGGHTQKPNGAAGGHSINGGSHRSTVRQSESIIGGHGDITTSQDSNPSGTPLFLIFSPSLHVIHLYTQPIQRSLSRDLETLHLPLNPDASVALRSLPTLPARPHTPMHPSSIIHSNNEHHPSTNDDPIDCPQDSDTQSILKGLYHVKSIPSALLLSVTFGIYRKQDANHHQPSVSASMRSTEHVRAKHDIVHSTNDDKQPDSSSTINPMLYEPYCITLSFRRNGVYYLQAPDLPTCILWALCFSAIRKKFSHPLSVAKYCDVDQYLYHPADKLALIQKVTHLFDAFPTISKVTETYHRSIWIQMIIRSVRIPELESMLKDYEKIVTSTLENERDIERRATHHNHYHHGGGIDAEEHHIAPSPSPSPSTTATTTATTTAVATTPPSMNKPMRHATPQSSHSISPPAKADELQGILEPSYHSVVSTDMIQDSSTLEYCHHGVPTADVLLTCLTVNDHCSTNNSQRDGGGDGCGGGGSARSSSSHHTCTCPFPRGGALLHHAKHIGLLESSIHVADILEYIEEVGLCKALDKHHLTLRSVLFWSKYTNCLYYLPQTDRICRLTSHLSPTLYHACLQQWKNVVHHRLLVTGQYFGYFSTPKSPPTLIFLRATPDLQSIVYGHDNIATFRTSVSLRHVERIVIEHDSPLFFITKYPISIYFKSHASTTHGSDDALRCDGECDSNLEQCQSQYAFPAPTIHRKQSNLTAVAAVASLEATTPLETQPDFSIHLGAVNYETYILFYHALLWALEYNRHVVEAEKVLRPKQQIAEELQSYHGPPSRDSHDDDDDDGDDNGNPSDNGKDTKQMTKLSRPQSSSVRKHDRQPIAYPHSPIIPFKPTRSSSPGGMYALPEITSHLQTVVLQPHIPHDILNVIRSGLYTTTKTFAELFVIAHVLGTSSDGNFIYYSVYKPLGYPLALRPSPSLSNRSRGLQTWLTCNHPNIIQYLGTVKAPTTGSFVVMEYAQFRSVLAIMKRSSEPLREGSIAYIVYSVLQALVYLHSRNIVHRDIKADNIIVNQLGCVKVSDLSVCLELSPSHGSLSPEQLEASFSTSGGNGIDSISPKTISGDQSINEGCGDPLLHCGVTTNGGGGGGGGDGSTISVIAAPDLSNDSISTGSPSPLYSLSGLSVHSDTNYEMSRPTSSVNENVEPEPILAGSPLWFSPEVILGVNVTQKTDIYSLGITIIEIAQMGSVPNDHLQSLSELAQCILHKPSPRLAPELQSVFSEDMQSFIAQCLIKDPQKRPGADELLSHPWLTQYNFAAVHKLLYETIARGGDLLNVAANYDKPITDNSHGTTTLNGDGITTTPHPSSSTTFLAKGLDPEETNDGIGGGVIGSSDDPEVTHRVFGHTQEEILRMMSRTYPKEVRDFITYCRCGSYVDLSYEDFVQSIIGQLHTHGSDFLYEYQSSVTPVFSSTGTRGGSALSSLSFDHDHHGMEDEEECSGHYGNSTLSGNRRQLQQSHPIAFDQPSIALGRSPLHHQQEYHQDYPTGQKTNESQQDMLTMDRQTIDGGGQIDSPMSPPDFGYELDEPQVVEYAPLRPGSALTSETVFPPDGNLDPNEMVTFLLRDSLQPAIVTGTYGYTTTGYAHDRYETFQSPVLTHIIPCTITLNPFPEFFQLSAFLVDLPPPESIFSDYGGNPTGNTTGSVTQSHARPRSGHTLSTAHPSPSEGPYSHHGSTTLTQADYSFFVGTQKDISLQDVLLQVTNNIVNETPKPDFNAYLSKILSTSERLGFHSFIDNSAEDVCTQDILRSLNEFETSAMYRAVITSKFNPAIRDVLTLPSNLPNPFTLAPTSSTPPENDYSYQPQHTLLNDSHVHGEPHIDEIALISQPFHPNHVHHQYMSPTHHTETTSPNVDLFTPPEFSKVYETGIDEKDDEYLSSPIGDGNISRSIPSRSPSRLNYFTYHDQLEQPSHRPGTTGNMPNFDIHSHHHHHPHHHRHHHHHHQQQQSMTPTHNSNPIQSYDHDQGGHPSQEILVETQPPSPIPAIMHSGPIPDLVDSMSHLVIEPSTSSTCNTSTQMVLMDNCIPPSSEELQQQREDAQILASTHHHSPQRMISTHPSLRTLFLPPLDLSGITFEDDSPQDSIPPWQHPRPSLTPPYYLPSRGATHSEWIRSFVSPHNAGNISNKVNTPSTPTHQRRIQQQQQQQQHQHQQQHQPQQHQQQRPQQQQRLLQHGQPRQHPPPPHPHLPYHNYYQGQWGQSHAMRRSSSAIEMVDEHKYGIATVQPPNITPFISPVSITPANVSGTSNPDSDGIRTAHNSAIHSTRDSISSSSHQASIHPETSETSEDNNNLLYDSTDQDAKILALLDKIQIKIHSGALRPPPTLNDRLSKSTIAVEEVSESNPTVEPLPPPSGHVNTQSGVLTVPSPGNPPQPTTMASNLNVGGRGDSALHPVPQSRPIPFHHQRYPTQEQLGGVGFGGGRGDISMWEPNPPHHLDPDHRRGSSSSSSLITVNTLSPSFSLGSESSVRSSQISFPPHARPNAQAMVDTPYAFPSEPYQQSIANISATSSAMLMSLSRASGSSSSHGAPSIGAQRSGVDTFQPLGQQIAPVRHSFVFSLPASQGDDRVPLHHSHAVAAAAAIPPTTTTPTGGGGAGGGRGEAHSHKTPISSPSHHSTSSQRHQVSTVCGGGADLIPIHPAAMSDIIPHPTTGYYINDFIDGNHMVNRPRSAPLSVHDDEHVIQHRAYQCRIRPDILPQLLTIPQKHDESRHEDQHDDPTITDSIAEIGLDVSASTRRNSVAIEIFHPDTMINTLSSRFNQFMIDIRHIYLIVAQTTQRSTPSYQVDVVNSSPFDESGIPSTALGLGAGPPVTDSSGVSPAMESIPIVTGGGETNTGQDTFGAPEQDGYPIAYDEQHPDEHNNTIHPQFHTITQSSNFELLRMRTVNPNIVNERLDRMLNAGEYGISDSNSQFISAPPIPNDIINLRHIIQLLRTKVNMKPSRHRNASTVDDQSLLTGKHYHGTDELNALYNPHIYPHHLHHHHDQHPLHLGGGGGHHIDRSLDDAGYVQPWYMRAVKSETSSSPCDPNHPALVKSEDVSLINNIPRSTFSSTALVVNPHHHHQQQQQHELEQSGGDPSPAHLLQHQITQYRTLATINTENLGFMMDGLDHHDGQPLSDGLSPNDMNLDKVATNDEDPSPQCRQVLGTLSGTSLIKSIQPQQAAISDFSPDLIKLGCYVGRGCNGPIELAFHLPTLSLVALKQIQIFDTNARHQIFRELQAYARLSSPYIVELKQVYHNHEDGTLILATPYMTLGDIKSFVNSSGPMNERLLQHIAHHSLQALAYLHDNCYLHRDIKPDNVLIHHSGSVKLADFGLLCELESSHQTVRPFLGTLSYLAPERIRSMEYGLPSDIYALGLTLIYAATGKAVYDSNDYFDILMKVNQKQQPVLYPHDGFSSEFCDLIYCMTKSDPKERLTAHQLLIHPFIANTRKSSPSGRSTTRSNSPIVKTSMHQETLLSSLFLPSSAFEHSDTPSTTSSNNPLFPPISSRRSSTSTSSSITPPTSQNLFGAPHHVDVSPENVDIVEQFAQYYYQSKFYRFLLAHPEVFYRIVDVFIGTYMRGTLRIKTTAFPPSFQKHAGVFMNPDNISTRLMHPHSNHHHHHHHSHHHHPSSTHFIDHLYSHFEIEKGQEENGEDQFYYFFGIRPLIVQDYLSLVKISTMFMIPFSRVLQVFSCIYSLRTRLPNTMKLFKCNVPFFSPDEPMINLAAGMGGVDIDDGHDDGHEKKSTHTVSQ